MKKINNIIYCLLVITIVLCSCGIYNSGSNSSTLSDSSSSSSVNMTSDTSSISTSNQSGNSSNQLSNITNTPSKIPSKAPNAVSSKPHSSTASSKINTSESETSSTHKPSGGTKYVAFTFDDGPSSTYTKKIVNELESYGGKGTFFVIGNRLNSSTGAAIQYAVSKGCEIGIHAYTHEYSYSKCDDETYHKELDKTADAIHKYLPDYKIKMMRPVGGAITSDRVKSCEYAVVNWSVDSNDWRYKKPSGDSGKINTIYHNIVDNVKDGDIILMHEIYSNSFDAFKKAAKELNSRGYKFVTVTELIGSENLVSGKKYMKK